MDTSKIIKGVVSNGRYTVTAPIVKEDYGLYLKIEGVELPSTYEVDFSNSENNGTSVTMIGNSDGVLIPRQFIDSGKDVFAFLYHVGEDFGRTVYKFRIPNKVRPDRTEETPTPEEQSVIDQVIASLNDAVDEAKDAQEAIENMSVSAQTLAEGESATVTKTEQDGVVHLAFGIPTGATGDTPTITASKTGDTTHIYADDVEIAQIEDGTDGEDGYSPTASVSKTGKVATITITDKNGTTSAQVSDGEDGTTGATPNITIGTVETLEPTESATASITGTPENPVLNLGIPQGDTGEVTQAEFDELSGEVSDLKEGLTNVYEVTGSANIYNPALPTTTGWLTNTGAVDATGTGANFSTTDFIPVAKNTDYIVKNVRVGYASPDVGSRILVALYDANKSYINGTFQNIVGASPMQVAVSSGNASYLRVSTLPTHLASEPQYGTYAMMVVVSGTDVSQYIPFTPTVYENRMQIVSGYGAVTEAEYNADMFDVDERIENVETAISGVSEVEYSKNIYDRTTQLTTGWLTNTGTVDATGTGANFATTDFIKIDKNTDYIITNERMNIAGSTVGSRILMALYDANQTYIANSFQNVVSLNPMKVTFNSGDAKYLRVSTLPMHMGIPTSEFALIVQKGSELDGYTTYWVRNVSTLYPQDNILFGKKYVACGDSLTAGDFTGYTDESGKTGVLSDAFSPEYGSYKTYPYWIASRNGMTLINSGINGSVMAISKEYIDGTQSAIDYRSPFSLQRYKDIPTDADYITLWFGVNDKDHTYLGTISDTTNETFYGAWNVVLPYLMENHPKAKIGIVITFGIPDSPYTQAVREVAEKWGVPYFDFPRGKQSPIIIRNKDADYAVDQSIVDWKFNYYSVAETNHHPNLIAHEYESTCLESWLRSL